MSKRCMGCGAVLQSEKKLEKGYIDSERLENAKYCYRCFRIMHYNEKLVLSVPLMNEYVIKEVNKNKKLVFFLVDFLTLSQEVIETFNQIKCKKVFVISKLDLLPKSFKKGKIIDWLKKVYGVEEEVLFISTLKDLHVLQIIKVMENRKEKSAYILGYSNAGKSTLINKLLMKNGMNDLKITTSTIPNTTLDFIKVPLREDVVIYDAPGFVLEHSFMNDNLTVVGKINTKKEIKPRTYQLKEGNSLVIEKTLEIIPVGKANMTCFLSNEIDIVKNFMVSDENFFVIDVFDDSDIVIKGLGFISVKKEQKFKIKGIDRDLIEIRKSMF